MKLKKNVQKLVHQKGMILAAANEKLRAERELEERRGIISERLSKEEELTPVINEVAEMIKSWAVDLYLKKPMSLSDKIQTGLIFWKTG